MTTTAPQILFLVGPRASGKTTVARALAQALGCPWVDTDAVLTARLGQSVADVVAAQGWEAFRAEESRTLQEVCAAPSSSLLVVATGGGMVLAEANRRFMRALGRVIYLQTSVAVMTARLRAQPLAAQRPSLGGVSLEEEVAEVLRVRQPLYTATAHLCVDAGQAPEALVAQIIHDCGL